MKTQFSTFTEFAQEIDRREQAKKDLIVPSKKMEMTIDGDLLISTEKFGINDVAHGQFAEKLGIPKRYYDVMPAIPGLRETNVNAWMHNSDKNYMVRTLDGNARALLSDRYKPMDNYTILQSFLPVLNEVDQFQVQSENLSDTKMYLQIIFPRMEAEITPGDVVKWGITLTNSEVGRGAVDVSTLVYRLICSNGMVGSSVLRKNHVGSRIGLVESDYDLYKDDTIQADMHAFQLKLRDILKDATSEISFQKQIEKFKVAAGDIITKPETVVKNVTKHFNMNESLSELILGNMVQDGNLNRWSLANGITALAHDMDADKAYEVERIGNQVIELNPSEWEIMSA